MTNANDRHIRTYIQRDAALRDHARPLWPPPKPHRASHNKSSACPPPNTAPAHTEHISAV